MAKHMIPLDDSPKIPEREPRGDNAAQPNEPLSGSKAVKNRNHSRQNHGEGH